MSTALAAWSLHPGNSCPGDCPSSPPERRWAQTDRSALEQQV